MNILSLTEENYLKAIYHLCGESATGQTATNSIATYVHLKPATVTDMLRKLRQKKLIHYKPYGKVHLTAEGNRQALIIVRKHRLWELFLYEKLEFTWDEVHEVAEQLEHIQSPKLIDKLDKFLGHPAYDPHGDPIPDKDGNVKTIHKKTLSEIPAGQTCKIVAVKDSSALFLRHLMQLGLTISSKIKVIERMAFDNSVIIQHEKGKQLTLSNKLAENLFIV
ncbi:MAG: metal-dependent transcriptional regulator [Flavobacterium sp.]